MVDDTLSIVNIIYRPALVTRTAAMISQDVIVFKEINAILMRITV